MLDWDVLVVARFLGAETTHEDNSSYTLRFSLWQGDAVLKVFPYSGVVDFQVFQKQDRVEADAVWHLDCAAICYKNGESDEDDEGIIFMPRIDEEKRPSHWLRIGRSGGRVQVTTIFNCND